ncbi:MAG: rhodanese-like domain-containing protein [Ilumatobacteraceae bacterium]
MVVAGIVGCSDAAGTAQVATPEVATTLTVSVATSSVVQLLDVAEAMTLAADPSVTVVDVRTPEEFAAGHIGRAELVDINAAGFGDRIAQFDRSATYLVYCHSGNRSGQATAVMAELGFTHVYDLSGGISAWQAAGAPVVT